MAEVSQRLGTGAHGLSALLRNRCRHMDSFSMSSCAASCGVSAPGGGEEESAGGMSPNKPVSQSQTTGDTYVRTHVHKTPVYVSPGVQRVGVVVGRLTSRSTRGYDCVVLPGGAVPSETLSSLQQLRRKFSTFIPVTLARGRQRDGGVPCNTCGAQQVQQHHLHLLDLWSIARGYSSGNSYRSRTAYYDILNTSPNATQSQIKTAYYKQSFVFHPDKNPGSEEAARRFSDVSEAYSVLGNIDLRRKYDRGILSLSDIRNPERPSSRASGGPQHHHQQQQARHTASQQQFSRHRGKTMFDFDAFYQAHYGEQLERERRARARKELHKARDKQRLQELNTGERWMDLLGVVLLVMGGVLLVSLR